jgi:hypothetical protein
MASVVTKLPKALTPWSAWLRWFAPELATDVGMLLQRLAPLLGPFKDRGQTGEPDWDGLDDLRTRGSYERLLASEWLLADELPDEFLRRAVSGEHIFLTPRPRRRRSQRTIIALFDAGPLQLGAARLAHIALWILLARRAAQVQGQMRWGVLQSPGDLIDATEVGHLKALLARRSFLPPHEQHLDEWQTALDDSGSVSGERWLIGSPYFKAGTIAFTHRVQLRKDLDGKCLDVSLLERGASRKVSLPLPKQESAVALLHGEFEPTLGAQPSAGDKHAVDLNRPPIISIDGTRVGVLHRDIPAVSSIYIPRSPREEPRLPRLQRWSYGYQPLSAMLMGKSLGILMGSSRQLRLWPTGMTLKPRPPQEQFHASARTDSWLPAAWLRGRQSHRVCVIDDDDRLLRWNATIVSKRELITELQMHVVAKNALALAQLSNDTAIFAYAEDRNVRIARLTADQEPRECGIVPNVPGSRVLFGRGCFYAVEGDSETWYIKNWNDADQSYHAWLPKIWRAIGVMRDKDGVVGLLSLEDNRHLRFHGHDHESQLLYTAPAQVVSHSVCPNSGLVALLTAERQLIVYSAATRELRLCMQTGRGDDADD